MTFPLKAVCYSFLLSSVFSPLASATEVETTKAEKAAQKEKLGYFNLGGWAGEVDMSYLRSSGNTQQESIGLGGKMVRNAYNFHHTAEAFFDLNKNTGVKDQQKWGTSYKLDYDFSDTTYVTGLIGYKNDQFGAFRERVTTYAGLGYPIITTDSYSWKIEGGPGVLFTKELPDDSYNTTLNAFANSLFNWTINDRSDLSNNTIVYVGKKNVVESKTALKVRINGSLSSKISYDVLYDSGAPLSRKKTDTIIRAGLAYDF